MPVTSGVTFSAACAGPASPASTNAAAAPAQTNLLNLGNMGSKGEPSRIGDKRDDPQATVAPGPRPCGIRRGPSRSFDAVRTATPRAAVCPAPGELEVTQHLGGRECSRLAGTKPTST